MTFIPFSYRDLRKI